jgi:putative flippase GtrA
VAKTVRFGIVGLAGFCVDAGCLALLLWFTQLGPFVSRLIAILAALSITWLLNRRFTFGPSGRSLAHEAARYGSVGISGSVLNYGIYSAILLVAPTIWPIFALVIASALVTIFSWFGYSKFVFSK